MNRDKPSGKYCTNCWRPATEEENYCGFCDNDKFGACRQQYTVKQWEWWSGMNGPVGTSDFLPWEWSEDGHITRGNGTQGCSGYSWNNVKSLHSKKNAYRK